MLLVEADRVIPGRFNPAAGEARPGRLAGPEVGDVVDELRQKCRGGIAAFVYAARNEALVLSIA